MFDVFFFNIDFIMNELFMMFFNVLLYSKKFCLIFFFLGLFM